MIEWKPRLLSLLVAAGALAVALGLNHGWLLPFNHGW
jgi:Na+(H+)/acetate symporter ActP